MKVLYQLQCVRKIEDKLKINKWGYDNFVQMIWDHNIISIHKSNNFNEATIVKWLFSYWIIFEQLIKLIVVFRINLNYIV